MSRTRYTIEQLLALQDSPLIQRPDNLPLIEQWLEQPAERGQGRPRTQNGKVEENDNPIKRPLLESRARTAQTGEELFLGPKMSFASASAARLKSKTATGEDKTATLEDIRQTFDRFAPRDKTSKEHDSRDKDNERQKPRYGHKTHGDEDSTNDTRLRRGDHQDKNREQKEGGVALDGADNRRSGPLRGKFEQPWFRDSDKPELRGGEDHHESNGNGGGWREREKERERARKGTSWNQEPRQERQPEWMDDGGADDLEHTQDDFAKWKESMKAGANGSDDKAANTATPPLQDTGPSSAFQSLEPADEIPAKLIVPEGGLFGLGAPKRDGEVSTPKASAKPKSSRFASFFAPMEGELPRPATEPVIDQTPASPKAPAPKNEDQEGFQNMMKMLRMGGTSSQGPQQSAFGPPPQEHELYQRGAPEPVHMSTAPLEGHLASPPPVLASPEMQQKHHMPQRPPQHHPRPDQVHDIPEGAYRPDPSQRSDVLHRSEAPRRQEPSRRPDVAQRPEPTQPHSERDFLLKLMQQPRGSPAFNEGQIYGQNYQSRSSSSEINSVLNGSAPRPTEKRRGPPPGFPSHVNDQAFHSNGHAGVGGPAEDRYLQQQRHHAEEPPHRSQMSPYEQASMFSRREEPKPQDIRPPPGFSNGSRGPPQHAPQHAPPPGFPQYHSQQPQQMQHQEPPHHRQPPHERQPPNDHQLHRMQQQQQQMRNPMASQAQGFDPRMQPPPHFPPPPQHQHQPPPQHQQPQQQQQRRPTLPPGMQVPAGYEGYGDMARRGPPMGYQPYGY